MLEWVSKIGAAFGSLFRRRVAHSEDLRRVVTELRAFLSDLTSAGGFGASDFLSETAKSRELELQDLIPRLRDRNLRNASEDVLQNYRQAWASSPPGQQRVVVAEERDPVLTGPSGPHVAAQLQRQCDAAHAALAAIQTVLDRLNRLERWFGPNA